eukprot:scaffold276_cov548-Prasinococcus_capsulatus_cf.AAC.11
MTGKPVLNATTYLEERASVRQHGKLCQLRVVQVSRRLTAGGRSTGSGWQAPRRAKASQASVDWHTGPRSQKLATNVAPVIHHLFRPGEASPPDPSCMPPAGRRHDTCSPYGYNAVQAGHHVNTQPNGDAPGRGTRGKHEVAAARLGVALEGNTPLSSPPNPWHKPAAAAGTKRARMPCLPAGSAPPGAGQGAGAGRRRG